VVKQIKEPVGTDSVLLKQLQNEALSMAKLKHPNVAMVFEHFVFGGYYFLVVEYIPGKTLSEVFAEREGQLIQDEVLEWATVMCDVISYMHKQNVLHRDITPDNVIMSDEGVIKFVDFGTMREIRYVTTRGTAGMGKYGYTPPEQWLGRPVPQSDIFALGATMYYLLSGFLPLSKAYLTGKGIEGQDFNPEFPPIRQKNPKVSAELEAVLQKALQLGVNSRYATADDFKQALLSAKKEPVEKPVLRVDCRRIDFRNVRPGQIITKFFTLKNVGSGNLIGKINTEQPWLEVSPTTIATNKHQEKVEVRLNSAGLSPGYSSAGDIHVSTNGGRVKVVVTVSTAAEIKPAPTVPSPKGMSKKVLFYAAGATILVVALVFGMTRIFGDHAAVPAPPPISPQVTTAGSRVVFQDSFRGPLLWDKVIGRHGPGSPQPPATTGDVRLENGDLHVSADYWWYNVYAVRQFEEVTGDFEASVRFRIMGDSSGATNVGIQLRHGDIVNETVGGVAELGYDGYYKKWVLAESGQVAKEISQVVTKNEWVQLTIRRTGNTYKWLVNGSQLYEESVTQIMPMTHMVFATGIGIHWQGGTHVHFDNASLLTPAPAPAPAPLPALGEGQIAFSSDRDGTSEIYVMNADGSNQIRLTYDNQCSSNEPCWSPDGTKIAYIQSCDRSNTQIHIMNTDGSNNRQLTSGRFTNQHSPAWSPNGSQVAFFSEGSNLEGMLCIIDSDGQNERVLVRSLNKPVGIAFSPDGKHIAFSYLYMPLGEESGGWRIELVDSDGKNRRILTNNNWADMMPSWSLDGTKIAFCSFRDGDMAIYVMEADGNNQRRLSDKPAWDCCPTWSPDGSRIAFESERHDGGKRQIYVMNADGSNLTRLTYNLAYEHEPAWSPR